MTLRIKCLLICNKMWIKYLVCTSLLYGASACFTTTSNTANINPDLRKLSAPDSGACWRACTENSACVGADYRPRTGDCWLKSQLNSVPDTARGINTLKPCKPSGTRPAEKQRTEVAQITKRVMNASTAEVRSGRFADSVEVDGKCYCLSTFDHGIGDMKSPSGKGTIKQACARIGEPPKARRNAWRFYNDIRCGNGPANTSIDERECPGLVGAGPGGCRRKGPKW